MNETKTDPRQIAIDVLIEIATNEESLPHERILAAHELLMFAPCNASD